MYCLFERIKGCCICFIIKDSWPKESFQSYKMERFLKNVYQIYVVKGIVWLLIQSFILIILELSVTEVHTHTPPTLNKEKIQF